MNLDIVEEAYERIISEKHFNTWIERIKKQYGELDAHAFAMLKHNCRVKQGSTRNNLQDALSGRIVDADEAEEVLSKLLYMLKNDGYLIEENGRYKFRSPMLRDFWFKRFVR